MFSAFQTFGRLGAGARAVAAAWTPAALWPTGTEPGMWIDPSNLVSQWQDSAGTTPVSPPGTVADSSNPVGLALDLRLGATALTDPGNHMLQATSTARPLVSARVNTLTYTEDFSNAIWVIDADAGNTVTKTLGQTDPLGGTSAVRLVMDYNTGVFFQCSFRYNGGLAAEQVNRSWWIKSNTGDSYNLYSGDTLITTIADTNWHRYDVNESVYSWGTRISSFSANADITVAFPQRELGTTATPYQSVPGDGSTYATAGFPVYQKYDGTDDGMATASFAAGTLINGMDCMIAVRRDSAAAMILGLYNGTLPYQGAPDYTRFFGVAETASSAASFNECGTPTVWVDGVQLTGGTAVTRGTLATALTVGDWHVLELRNLDLSAWTAARFGAYYAFVFNGPRGDILLYPSTASTEDKDAARQYLADKYGVTLA